MSYCRFSSMFSTARVPVIMKCYDCGRTDDLRPYGPKGAMVCYDCATSTPEREAETIRNCEIQLGAAGPIALIDGTEVGPYPARHHPVIRRLLGELD